MYLALGSFVIGLFSFSAARVIVTEHKKKYTISPIMATIMRWTLGMSPVTLYLIYKAIHDAIL